MSDAVCLPSEKVSANFFFCKALEAAEVTIQLSVLCLWTYGMVGIWTEQFNRQRELYQPVGKRR